MPDNLLTRIDNALDALLLKTPQLLAHEPAELSDYARRRPAFSGEGQFDRAADTGILWEWITGELRLVLEAVGKDKKAARCLAEMLPKPCAKPLCYVDPLRFPVPLREEYERAWAKAERQRLDEYTQWLTRWRADVLAIEQQIEQEAAQGHSTEPYEAKLKAAREAAGNWERNIKEFPKECAHARAAGYGKGWASCDWSDYSEAFQAEVEKIAQREKGLQHKWEAKFAGEPAVWLWMVWKWYDKFTNLKVPAGVPEWPEAEGGGFSLPLAYDTLSNIGSYRGMRHPLTGGDTPGLCAGRAANYLMEALKTLRERLGGRQKHVGRRPPLDRNVRPLTAKQIEAMQIIGECEGNLAEAARRLGIDRKSLHERYDTALKKLGPGADALLAKHRTQSMPEDYRGQPMVASKDAGPLPNKAPPRRKPLYDVKG